MQNIFTHRIMVALLVLMASASAVLGQEKIILLNEGNWQTDNSKVTYFEDGKIVSNQWYREVNNAKIGDTPNDIIQINDNLIAIAVNWSNIIQFIRPDGRAVAATEDIPNNRKLATDGRYVYVTSYAHECMTTSGKKNFVKGYVAKIDITSFKVVSVCEVGYEPEGIAYFDGHLFVANTGGYAFQENHDYESTVSIINAETMEKVKDVDTHHINLYGKLSQSGQYLCINSTGDYYNVEACGIIFDCKAALESVEPCFTVVPYALTYNCVTPTGDFYAIGSKYSYNTGDYQFGYATISPSEVMASGGTRGISETLPGTVLNDIKKMAQPYGIYVNPYTGYIYATDAKSFASAGDMYQWKPDGTYVAKHKVYINPAHFLALPPDGHFDGIESARVPQTPTDKCYNIAGQRVKKANGIVIKDGKKVKVKW